MRCLPDWCSHDANPNAEPDAEPNVESNHLGADLDAHAGPVYLGPNPCPNAGPNTSPNTDSNCCPVRHADVRRAAGCTFLL